MASSTELQRSFTVEEYHLMGEAGVFGPEERVELIRGVIRRMSPKGKRHVLAVSKADQMLQAKLAGRACIFVQDPLFGLDRKSEPEPDLIVVSGTDPEAYVRGKARPLLVIEVADSSLDYDREEKAPLYAEAGVPESWIVNLVDDVLEVYRDPRGTSYAEMRRLTSGESVSPLSWPDLEIDITELIPSALGP